MARMNYYKLGFYIARIGLNYLGGRRVEHERLTARWPLRTRGSKFSRFPLWT